MNISSKQAARKLHEKLGNGIDTLMSAKSHLNYFHKDMEATVVVQLKSAKSTIREKKHGVKETLIRMENLAEERKEETVEAVAEWKAKRAQAKLAKRADRAEEYAETCIALTLNYAAEAELAVLEAITARQDAMEAARKDKQEQPRSAS